MLLRAAIIRPWRSFRKLISLRSSAKLSSIFNFKALTHLDKECGDFLPWLERKAGAEISSHLYIGKSSYGRSLFASKSIQAGDRILRVPYSAQIASDNLLPKISALLDDEVGSVSKLAIVLLVEQKLCKESEWAPYINCLPQLENMHSTESNSDLTCSSWFVVLEDLLGVSEHPYLFKNILPIEPGSELVDVAMSLKFRIFWGNHELDMIFPSYVYRETIKQKAQIEKDFLTIKPVLEHFPRILRSITFQDFMHAYALVKSRARGSRTGVSLVMLLSRHAKHFQNLPLIPFADFLNHDGLSEAVVVNDEEKQVSEVIADRNYAPHEEINTKFGPILVSGYPSPLLVLYKHNKVLIRYGKFSNAALLLDFGFSLPYNIHDQVELQIDIPHNDFLRERKLEILQRYHLPTIEDDNGFKSSWNSFIIKEVKSTLRKGKGLPQSLRAFARVLCCTSDQDLNDLAMEAAQTDGRLARRALRNSSREIEAHEILLLQITQLIEEYNASIESLGPANSPSKCKRYDLRRQMALDVLTGELHVLKSASTWLKNYCASLLE